MNEVEIKELLTKALCKTIRQSEYISYLESVIDMQEKSIRQAQEIMNAFMDNEKPEHIDMLLTQRKITFNL